MSFNFYILTFFLAFSFFAFSNDLYKKAEKEVAIPPSKNNAITESKMKSPSGLLKAQMKKNDIMPTYDEFKMAIINSQPIYRIDARDFLTSAVDHQIGVATHVYALTKTFKDLKFKAGGALTLLAGQSQVEHRTLPLGDMRSFVLQPTVSLELKSNNWPKISLLNDIGYSYLLVAYSSPDKFNNFSEEIQTPLLSLGLRFQVTNRLSFIIKQVAPLRKATRAKIALESTQTLIGLEGGIN